MMTVATSAASAGKAACSSRSASVSQVPAARNRSYRRGDPDRRTTASARPPREAIRRTRASRVPARNDMRQTVGQRATIHVDRPQYGVAEPSSGDVEHALERDAGPLGGARVDRDAVDHLAGDECSSTHARCGPSMRNMVEHGHTSGSSDMTVRSGCSSAMRCTMWISVPTPMTDPGARRVRRSRGCARWNRRGRRARRRRARTPGARSPRPSGCSARNVGNVLGPEPLVHRAVPLPQQEACSPSRRAPRGRRARGAGSTRASSAAP